MATLQHLVKTKYRLSYRFLRGTSTLVHNLGDAFPRVRTFKTQGQTSTEMVSKLDLDNDHGRSPVLSGPEKSQTTVPE